jgi:hypothetical protein
MPSLRRSAASLRLFSAFQGLFRSIGIWPDRLRTKPRRGIEKTSSLMMSRKSQGNIGEGQEGVEKAGVVRHKDIGVLRVKTFLPLDMKRDQVFFSR